LIDNLLGMVLRQIFTTLLVFVVCCGQAIAQDYSGDDEEIDVCQKQVDSILALVKPDTPTDSLARIYNRACAFSDNMDTTLKYANLSLSLCKDNDIKIIADNYYNIGYAYYMQDRSREALTYFFDAADLHYECDNIKAVATDYIAIGRCYHDINLQDSGLVYLGKALDIYISLKDTAYISYAYQSVGIVNMNLGFYATAKEYYQKALQIDSLAQNYLDVAYDYQYLGYIDIETEDYENSIRLLRKSATMFDTIPSDDLYYVMAHHVTYSYMSDAYLSLAYKTGEKAYADSCLACIEKIGTYFFDNGHYNNQFTLLKCKANYLSFYGRDREALDILHECEKYLDAEQNDTYIVDYYSLLSSVYKKVGDYKKALEASDKMHELRASAINDSTMNVVARFEAEQEVKIHRAESEAKQTRMRIIIVSLAVGLLLSFFLVFYIVKMLNIKRKANESLTYKNSILDQQKSEIEAQRDEIEEVNRKLYSSINYAQKIQTAAIAQQADVDALFPDNFVYYKPRDIVSGDFYYVARCGRFSVLITADCTGHGIPGAFLSMLGISALKEFCVTEEDAANPGAILDRMRNLVKSTLVSDKNRIIDDGMDMTICSFDFGNMELRYAAADQTGIIVRQGKAIKLKGDRMPVGRYFLEKEHFTTITMAIEKGDMVYSFSDGIQDQPGGQDENQLGKKFLLKNLEDFLVEHYAEPLEIQRNHLHERISEWRNGRPQVDDITLIGVRV